MRCKAIKEPRYAPQVSGGEWLEFRAVPAILFYLMYTTGILVFASAAESWLNVPLYGARLLPPDGGSPN